ncbi:MAG TPA: hypothetical protein VFY28_02810 [Candidatus Paceibacterota bacterium]|nr:hypothetical protein [Candidatus Paceibacterota bacterium]
MERRRTSRGNDADAAHQEKLALMGRIIADGNSWRENIMTPQGLSTGENFRRMMERIPTLQFI